MEPTPFEVYIGSHLLFKARYKLFLKICIHLCIFLLLSKFCKHIFLFIKYSHVNCSFLNDNIINTVGMRVFYKKSLELINNLYNPIEVTLKVRSNKNTFTCSKDLTGKEKRK